MDFTHDKTNHPPLAIEWNGDFMQCDPSTLTNHQLLIETSYKAISQAGLVILQELHTHVFPSTKHGAGGITMMGMLQESHFALHTWPEYATALISICSCNQNTHFLIFVDLFKEALRAHHVISHLHPRAMRTVLDTQKDANS